MTKFACFIVATALAAGLAVPLAAQETGNTPTRVRPQPPFQIDPNSNFVLRYDVRLGAMTRPAYFGSDEYVVSPDFAINFDYARLKGLAEYGSLDGDAPARAFGLRGSLRFIGERSAEKYSELEGLDDVDPTLELGLGLVYRQKNFEAWADTRYGVIGHNTFAGEIGADGVYYPNDNWELRLGPRAVWGTNAFAETYFGVTASEAASSGLDQYQAAGGLLGAGFEASARYRFNELWGVEAAVRGDLLLNDAADSPITEMGSEDQFMFRLGVTRELILQF